MIKLSKISTEPPKDFNKEETVEKRRELAQEIAELQYLLYAESKRSILVVLQGMDSSGKDGVSTKVFRYCSPIGISATAFKKPTEKELAHDFLWRAHQVTPEHGQIKIFNRSHYEDILIQRVHHWIDLKTVRKRMDAINHFEELLQFDNNTTIVKFYLHLSKDRQKEKLQERIDNPEKNWKHKSADWKEREHWDEYMKAYEYAINKSKIPWHIVPSDKQWYRDYFVAKTMVSVMKKLRMKRPVLTAEELKVES